MLPERSCYFTQKDIDFSRALPADCTWQFLIENQKILSPGLALQALRLANDFLITAPGPNLSRRLQLVPQWFSWWFRILTDRERTTAEYVKNEGIISFDRVGQRLHNEKNTGVLFVAGAEGHEGHRDAADWMRLFVVPIWAFEQDSYFRMVDKARGGPPIAFGGKTINMGPLRVTGNCVADKTGRFVRKRALSRVI